MKHRTLVGLIVLTTFIVAAVSRDLYAQDDAEKVKQMIETIKARGEPTTAEELKKNFPVRQGVEDVTAIWLEGMEPLLRQAYIDASQNLPIVGADSKTLLPESGPIVSECEALIRNNEYSLQKFYVAVDRGGYARFPIDYSKLYLDLPHIKSANDASNLIKLDLELSARRGDIARAGKSLKALFRIWRIFDGEPTDVSQIFVFYRYRNSKEALAKNLLQLRFMENDLKTIQSEIRDRDPAGEMKKALMGERVICFNAMQDLSQLDEKIEKGSHAPNSDILFYLGQMERRIALCDLPSPEALTEFRRVELDYFKHSARKNYGKGAVSDLFLAATSLATEMIAKDIATSRAADAGIAIEFYRREHSKLPETLEALTPKYLPSVPLDPFTGEPMIYKVEERGFTIYSLGKNIIDDGGRIDNKPGEDNRIRDEGLFFPLK